MLQDIWMLLRKKWNSFKDGFNEALRYIVIEALGGCIATHIHLDLRRNKKVGQLRICYEWQQL